MVFFIHLYNLSNLWKETYELKPAESFSEGVSLWQCDMTATLMGTSSLGHHGNNVQAVKFSDDNY